MHPRAPSGEQHEISFGEQRATIVEVGGGIRDYRAGERDVLEPYAFDAICDGGHGAVLVPWPNRLGAGRYDFDGASHQLALTEPARGNAIHGLMRWASWRASARSAPAVTMSARVAPQPGYPFALELDVSYELGEGGLTVSATALNAGERACPYGFGQHPYLSPGAATLDECTLLLRAGSRVAVDEATLLPVGTLPVAGTELDFNAPRPLKGLDIDDALTDLSRDGDGLATATLAAPDGTSVELWADVHHTVLQVFTGGTLAPARRRTALAVEPMTCPADAFRSGDGLIRLGAGESVTTRWGVRLRKD